MRSHSVSFAAFAVFFGALLTFSTPVVAEPWVECRDRDLFRERGGPEAPRSEVAARLRNLEASLAGARSRDEISACYRELADDYRELGRYLAEELYLRAVDLSEEPRERARALEAIARYYRTFRGAEGLFAESEDYYLRAERAVEEAIQAALADGATPAPGLLRLREQIIRGRIELNKREGLGILIPRQPQERFGVFLGSQVEYGDLPVRHNDLVSENRFLRDKGIDFQPRQILREPRGLGQHYRLRVRFGRYPYLDLGWHDVDLRNAVAEDWRPGEFKSFDAREFEVGLEDTFGLAPIADVLWRLEYRRGESSLEDWWEDDDFYRFTGSTTLTRNFGRLKASLDLLGSYASIDPVGRSPEGDWTAAAALRVLHFPDSATTERRMIDPRGYEYAAGFVQHQRTWEGQCGTADQVEDTFFAGIKLAEVVPRTDVRFLSNYFRNKVTGNECRFAGRVDVDRRTSDLELNLILTHRVLDYVNEMDPRQADRPLGFAQWAFDLRLFEDISTRSVKDFESRGAVLSSFVELFSGCVNRSTIIFEVSYELRDYHHLGNVQHLFRTGIRLGF